MHGNEKTPGTSLSINSEVAEFIHSRINFERLPAERYRLVDFKLERMRRLLHRLDDPQQQLPAVHIAGTKGKGSTAAMTASMLQAAGHRVGLFTSPHLEHFGERMTVNGTPPGAADLRQLLEELRPVVAAVDRESDSLKPTFFEVLTAMAWLHFRNQKVDLVVLETGLGGRLDATNLCHPLITIITSISRDHERLLGSTLAAIASEKAGIIKSGIPVLSGVTNPEPQTVIRQTAVDRKSDLFELDQEILVRFQSDDSNSDPVQPACSMVDLQTPWERHSNLCSPLPGEHQARNLALAVSAVGYLNSTGWDVDSTSITTGLRQVRWPLRIEVLRRHPLIIVDAAHNVASIAALIATLSTMPVSRRILVFATARDKDAAGMLDLLDDAFDRVILTRFVKNPRAVTRSQLEEIAAGHLSVPCEWVDDPTAAYARAAAIAGPDDLVCVTGSFFLAAEFRAVVCGN